MKGRDTKDETLFAKEFQTMINSISNLMMRERGMNVHRDSAEGGWKQLTPKFIVFELYYHIGKLQSALANDNNRQMEESIGDIANYLSFFLHNKKLGEFRNATVLRTIEEDSEGGRS